MPSNARGSVSARLSVWVSRVSAARNCSSVPVRTSSPPGSCAVSASAPCTRYNEARCFVPASVKVSDPGAKSKAARPARRGSGAPGAFEDALDVGAQLRLPPVVSRGPLGAGGLSGAGGLEQRRGRRGVEPGVVARRQPIALARSALAGVFSDKRARHVNEPSPPRMIRLVHGPEIVPVDVSVKLRGREVRVTEHLLHRAQVGAALEQVGGERVAQGVRCDALGQPCEPGGALDDPPGPDARQGRAAGIEKYDPPSLAPVEARSDLAYVQRHRTQGATTQRDDPLFRALAEDPGHAVLVQHILEREPYQLGDARPGRVRELEDGPIADGERLVGVGRAQQTLDLRDRQDRGEPAPLTGTLQPLARVPRGLALAYEKAIVRPNRGDLAPNGRGR